MNGLMKHGVEGNVSAPKAKSNFLSVVLPFVVTLAIFICASTRAEEKSKPASVEAETSAEAKAKAAYDAEEKAAKETEAEVAPLKAAMQKADRAYADARKTANAKRQLATDAKNLSGDSGVKDLKRAEANLVDAVKALTNAINAKPPLDKALVDAKAAAFPLQQAYDAADKAAKDAETAAKAAAEAANKLDDETKKATAQATVRRRSADSAKGGLTRAQQAAQNFQSQIAAAPKKLSEAEALKKSADDALANAKSQAAAVTTAYQSADQSASAAEVNAKPVSGAEEQQAENDAVAKRKAADAAKSELIQVWRSEQQAQMQVNAAAKNLTDAPAQKKVAEEALANAKKQVADATAACKSTERAALAAEASARPVSESEKIQAANDAVAKRKSFDAAKAALALALQNEQQAQAQADKSAKNLADAQVQKKAADDALTNAKKQIADATTAFQSADRVAMAAEANAKMLADRFARSDEAKKKLADDSAAKRKAADATKAALTQAQQNEQQAQAQLNTATKNLGDTPGQKKAADDALADAKNKVAAAMTAQQAAEPVAVAAEANAKAIAERAGRSAEEKKKLADDAVAKRKTADVAKAAMTQAQQNEHQAQAQADKAARNIADAPAQKKSADDALANAKKQVATATTTLQSAEQSASAAEANVKEVSAAEKDQAAADAANKRKAADAAKATLTQAQQNEKQAHDQVNATTKNLNDAPAQKKSAEEALANAKKQVAALTTALQSAEQAASAAEANAKVVTAAEKDQAAAEASTKRKAADAAKAALTQAQQNEKRAQDQVNVTAKNLVDAPTQKKAADDTLANAKNLTAAATTAFQSADQAVQCADVVAKVMAERASWSKAERKKAENEAAAKRKAADMAKGALILAQQNEQQAQNQVNAATKNLADAPAQKKAADGALVNAGNLMVTATKAYQSTEPPALAADENAKILAERFGRSKSQKEQAASDAVAKRKVADAAKTAMAQALKVQKDAQSAANSSAQKLSRAEAQKNQAVAGLATTKNQITAATAAAEVTEQAAKDAEKSADEKNRAAADASAKRKAAADAAAALATAQQGKQEAQIAAATAANKAAQEAAKEILKLDEANKQAAADAAAKRKAANEAKTALDSKAKAQDEAAVKASNAGAELTRSETRKKTSEEEIENLKKRIASAKQTFEADEKAAQTAEAAAAPLKVEAEKTRAAYTDAMKVADDKRALVEKAKTALYRLVSAKQVAKIMESTEPPVPANKIDEIVFAKLKALGIQPVLCSDAVFVRRAYLDLTGTLPSAEEARAFIQSSDKNKRVTLIDSLLDQPAHIDYWAMKWSDILKVKAEFPVKVWPNAAQAYHRWIWESVAKNKPYDQFVRELLTSSGSDFRDGPVNFYRAIQEKTPVGIASAVGLAVMGTRVLLWPQDRRTNMGVFFSQIGYKPTSEWKEEIVFWDPLKSVAVPGSIAPGVDSVAKAVAVTDVIPQALTNALTEPGPIAAIFPDGTKTTIPPDRDPREVYADWLIRPENPWFAKAIANRTWAWAMGRGIIHEPDDIRDNNPPSNPELLTYLEKELVSSGYNLKNLKRLIFTSTTYQFSSIQRSNAPEAKANFASYQLRRVEAEVLIDALNEITGGSDLYTSAVPEPFTYIPKDMSAVELADGSVTSSFLSLFGRSSRSTGMEAERVNELASTQWLYMLNSAAVQNKLQGGPKLAAILSQGGKPNEIAERLYLTILSRFPTDADLASAEEYAKSGATKGNDVWIDVAWSLINSPEFLLRH